jgi:hypothetical protein
LQVSAIEFQCAAVGFDVRNTFLKVKRASEKHHKAVEKRHDAAVKRYEGNNTVASKLEVEQLATELSDASLEMECDREHQVELKGNVELRGIMESARAQYIQT